MQNNPTQNNTPAANATPAKKQWQKPDFYLLDSGDINSGNVPTGIEGSKTPNNKAISLGGTNSTKFYQS